MGKASWPRISPWGNAVLSNSQYACPASIPVTTAGLSVPAPENTPETADVSAVWANTAGATLPGPEVACTATAVAGALRPENVLLNATRPVAESRWRSRARRPWRSSYSP